MISTFATHCPHFPHDLPPFSTTRHVMPLISTVRCSLPGNTQPIHPTAPRCYIHLRWHFVWGFLHIEKFITLKAISVRMGSILRQLLPPNWAICAAFSQTAFVELLQSGNGWIWMQSLQSTASLSSGGAIKQKWFVLHNFHWEWKQTYKALNWNCPTFVKN